MHTVELCERNVYSLQRSDMFIVQIQNQKLSKNQKGVGTQNTACCHGISECGMQEVAMNIV